MNVEKEIAAADRRVKAQIDANVRAALIRLGFDPDAEAARARAAEVASGAEALGMAWRSLVDGMAAFASAFNRGYNGGVR